MTATLLPPPEPLSPDAVADAYRTLDRAAQQAITACLIALTQPARERESDGGRR